MLANGRILGPYSTEFILKMIREGRLNGSEFVKHSDSGDWTPVNQTNEFFDALLEQIVSVSRHSNNLEQRANISNSNTANEHNSDLAVNEAATVIKPMPTPERCSTSEESYATTPQLAVDIPPSHIPLDSSPKNPFESRLPTHPSVGSQVTTQDIPESQTQVLELTSFAEIEQKISETRRPQNRKLIYGLFVAAALLFTAYFLYHTESGDVSGTISLLSPQYKKDPSAAGGDIEAWFKEGMSHFLRDQVESYVQAQSYFVRIIEAKWDHLPARGFLCLTYMELWPYVDQNAKNNEAFKRLLKDTKTKDPVGEFGAYCEIGRLLAAGQIQEARGISEYYLNQNQFTQSPVLITLKADILGRVQDFKTAIAYADSAIKHWPQWIKPKFLLAQFYSQSGEFAKSYEVIHEILSISPKHKAAWAHKGLLEFRNLRKLQDAEVSLQKAISLKGIIPKLLELQVLLALANLYYENQKPDLVEKYATLALSIQPQEERAKNLLTKIGKPPGQHKSHIRVNELIYLGDQYVAMGDCFSAQAEYKAAFDLDPRQAFAAYKAARCLWTLSQPLEAIDWLQKAIKSDPQFVDGAVLLADYLSQRYQFETANQVLLKAAQTNRNHPDILKGFGVLEYRRNNLNAAIEYLQRSLKLADNNVEALVYLAKGYAAKGDFEKAQNMAVKALEIESSNPEAIATYAKNMAQYQGAESAINYLKQNIEKFAFTLELRLALAEVYFSLERYQEAEKIYSQLIDFNPKYKKAWIGIGKSQQNQLKYQPAMRSFIEAAILDPFDAEPLFLLGVLYRDREQWDQALTHFEKAAKANPYFPNLYYHAGLAALGKGDLKLAMSYVQKERKANPNLAESYLLAAELYDRNHEYALCASEYQKAISLRPQGADIYVKMARCYRLAGNLDIAESMLTLAINIESGRAEIYREQGAIFEAKAEKAAAFKAYEKYLLLSPNAPDKKIIEQTMQKLSP